MTIFVIIIHVIVCLALIMIVLLQTGKGADMGASFGGTGSQALFGSTGASTFLSKATTAVAVVFMVTCFYLAYQSSQKNATSIMEDVPAPVTAPIPDKSPADVTTESAPESPAASTDKAVEVPATGETEQPATAEEAPATPEESAPAETQ